MYPRLGATTLDLSTVADATYPGLNQDNSIDWNTLISQGLTDVTQLVRPGTPSPVPIFTPGTTAAASLFSNPAMLLLLAGGVYLLSRRR